MLRARRRGWWRPSLEMSVAGRPVTTWTSGWADDPGGFSLDGRTYTVGAEIIRARYRLVHRPRGAPAEVVADTDTPRGHWSVRAAPGDLRFHRSWLGTGAQFLFDERQIGHVSRHGPLGRSLEAELPGVPLLLQVFVLVVIELEDCRMRSRVWARRPGPPPDRSWNVP